MTREEWLEPKDWEEPDYMYDDAEDDHTYDDIKPHYLYGDPEAIECWHMLSDDRTMTQYADPETGESVITPDIIVEVGATYSIDESPILCVRGYHGSRRLLDALLHAPGSLCCRVLIGGEISEESDKLAGQWRKVLWMKDILALLREFTCDIAEMTLDRYNITNPLHWEAIHTKRRWLDGGATDEDIKELQASLSAEQGDVALWVAETQAALAPYAAWATALTYTRYGLYCTEWDEVNELLEQRVWDAHNGLA